MAAIIYSLYKIIRRFLKLKGYKTKHEKDEEQKMNKMRHYFYHCERNPEGFLRLKSENYKKI